MISRIKMRRIAALLSVVFLLAVMVLPASADPVIDPDAKGSITVTLKDQNTKKAVSGGEFTLYQVAYVTADDADLSYVYTNGFENCGISINGRTDLDDSKLPGQFDSFREAASNTTFQSTTVTVDQNGKAAFADLQTGLYLLVQSKAADGYNTVSSFLVSVPSKEDGVYIYDVDASPKVEVYTTPKPVYNPPEVPKEKKLPQTGQLNWPIPVLAVAGVLLFAYGWNKQKETYKYET